MGALLIDMLQRAQRRRRVVSLQTGGTLFLGYVLSINPELLVLRTITRQGLLTGVRTLGLDAVSEVHFDDRYVRLIEFKENNPAVAYGQAPAPEGLDAQYYTVPALLQHALDTHQLLLLETQSEHDFYGYVVRLSEEELLLEVYTQFGEPDGHTVLRLDDVRSVVWSDEDTRTIELLLRAKGAEAKE